MFVILNNCITNTARLTVGMTSWGGEFRTGMVPTAAIGRLDALWDAVTLTCMTTPSSYSLLYGK